MDAAPSPDRDCTFLDTVADIFNDFCVRRSAIIRALTRDVEVFYSLCDPGKDVLGLYGNGDGTWRVSPPVDDVPAALPEPTLGINFTRDDMNRREWLAIVAVYSGSWLLSIAFFHAIARLNCEDRVRLFDMINELPTVYEVVFGMVNGATARRSTKVENTLKAEARGKDHSDQVDNNNNNNNGKAEAHGEYDSDRVENNVKAEARGEDDSVSDQVANNGNAEAHGSDQAGEVLCGTCGGTGTYTGDEFWIGCYFCGRWNHRMCVKMSFREAANIVRYKCPACTSKKSRLGLLALQQ